MKNDKAFSEPVRSASSAERQALKGREKTEYFNNLVYSSFQYAKGAASFRKEYRFK
jgi:hypothetical protein